MGILHPVVDRWFLEQLWAPCRATMKWLNTSQLNGFLWASGQGHSEKGN